MVDGCTSEQVRELVDGCLMVSNSPTAHRLWDVPGSRWIRHGMSPEEWPSTDYARNEVLVVQHYGRTHPEFRNVEGVAKIEKTVKLRWVGRDIRFESFDQYRHYLQSSSIFLQPSFASPNPRSRTEAMLTGLAVVTTNSHGEDEYITNGVNGFASNDDGELVEFLQYLLANPQRARTIGQAGRATAQDIFHVDRFVDQWDALLREYVG
jgi:glycosyltransferase involved in cell wall biosynthesis